MSTVSASLSKPGKQICRPTCLQAISRIKPQMMQKVLSSICQEKTDFISNGASNTSGGLKLMELFPQHKSDVESQTDLKPSMYSSDLMSEAGSLQEEPKLSQLTVFYNGKVNTYNVPEDKAREIMKFAASSLNRETKIDDEVQQTPSTPFLSSANNEVDKISKLAGGLSQVRRQSLQRFLQMRKDRLNSLSPYPTTKTLQSDAIQTADLKLSLV